MQGAPVPLPQTRTRAYGAAGRPVVLLHGGPGAPGYMAPVARGFKEIWDDMLRLQQEGVYPVA
jgi:pimeloyl-ACP methyl ester carboxylesterase